MDYAEHTSLQRLRTAMEAAQRQDLLDGRALEELIARAPGRRGLPKLIQVIALLSPEPPWTQSELERRFLELVRQAGLPEPKTNFPLHGELADFYWPHARLVVEVDGYDFHKDRRQFEADRRKDITLQLAGERVVRYTAPRVKYEPASVIAELRLVAARR